MKFDILTFQRNLIKKFLSYQNFHIRRFYLYVEMIEIKKYLPISPVDEQYKIQICLSAILQI